MGYVDVCHQCSCKTCSTVWTQASKRWEFAFVLDLVYNSNQREQRNNGLLYPGLITCFLRNYFNIVLVLSGHFTGKMDESWMKLFVLLAAMVSNIINCSVGVFFRGSVLVILLYCCERQWVFNVSLCPNKLTDEHSLCTLWHAFLHIVKWNLKPCCIFSRVFSNRVG